MNVPRQVGGHLIILMTAAARFRELPAKAKEMRNFVGVRPWLEILFRNSVKLPLLPITTSIFLLHSLNLVKLN